MDPSACKVIYIDDRFNTERWITRDGLVTPSSPKQGPQADFGDLPPDLQSNINAFLTVFNQVFVCHSGRLFSSKLSELHEHVKLDCTPIIACFDVGSESKHGHIIRSTRPRFNPASDSPTASPTALRREFTFSSESDESYGLQLLSRIASDLQVEEDAKLIIPVAIVRPARKDSYDRNFELSSASGITRSPYGSETAAARVVDTSNAIDPQVMLQCLDAGALDVVKSPLDKAGIMGLTVHAYRRHKMAKIEQASFMASAHRSRKQSWVGVEEKEQPYAYLREAMVRKLLRGICEPETTIEGFQGREIHVDDARKAVIAEEIGKWGFDAHMFDEDELVYGGYCMLNHALQLPELERYRMDENHLLQFMQGCRLAYNHFVLYHNFRHASDVLQSVFYFLVQIGTLPPYPLGSTPPPFSEQKSPIAKLLSSFEAMTLLISAIGHDVGHPGVNNMFLVKLNAPLAQLYNDQSVLEAFHCAAYSQILRRHWPAAFNNKALRKLMISTILATDMGVHADYMQQMGNLQERIHQKDSTDGWAPKDKDAFRILTCGLIIKCADISNVARPWAVAEKWTHLLQKEFANQGDMEKAVSMETTLFGGPPELGNMLKLANGQIGFMTIFAHPLFANMADIIPAMSFAADEILTNKGVWFTRAEQEKRKVALQKEHHGAPGSISPRSQSPAGLNGQKSHPNKAPLRNSRTSTQAAVAGLPSPKLEAQDPSHAPRIDPTAEDTRELKNGDSAKSAPEVMQHENDSDDRRDMGTSMRAGAESVPDLATDDVKSSSPDHSNDRSQSPLSKFTFATSNPSEPVRTYDPEQHYPPIHSSARTSMPVTDYVNMSAVDRANKNVSKSPVLEEMPGSAATTTTTNESATSRYSDDADTDAGTTIATDSSAPLQQQQSPTDFEKRRARAASAPNQNNPNNSLPVQQPQQVEGMSSQRSLRSGWGFGSSRDSSKQDVRSSTMNGEAWEAGSGSGRPSGENDGDETPTKERGGGGSGGTMRRRSRIRLAFWKKKKSSSEDNTATVGGGGDGGDSREGIAGGNDDGGRS